MHGLELVELGHPAALLQVGYSRQEPSSPPLPREQLWEVLDPRPEGETLEIVLSIRKHPYSFIKFSIFFLGACDKPGPFRVLGCCCEHSRCPALLGETDHK